MVKNHPLASDDSASSDEEYYEVIGSPAKVEVTVEENGNEAPVVAPSDQALTEQDSEEDGKETVETVATKSEEIPVNAICEPVKEKDEETIYQLPPVSETLRRQQIVNEREARLIKLNGQLQNKKEEAKRYATGIEAFNKELQARAHFDQGLFYLALFDILLALGTVAVAEAKGWYALAFILIAKGLLFALNLEFRKNDHRDLKLWMKASFPEITNSDLENASSVAFTNNNGDAAIDINDGPRTVELSKETSGSFGFWNFGNSIGYVFSGTPAEENGMRRGDEIISIYGTNVETMGHWEIQKLFKGTVATGKAQLELRFNPERLKEKEAMWNRWTIVVILVAITVAISIFKLI